MGPAQEPSAGPAWWHLLPESRPHVWAGTALLFPLQPFIKWNGLLNRVLCGADLFMLPFFPPT